MVIAYLLVGLIVCTSYNAMPLDSLTDVQADESRPPSSGELATAAAVWCLAVAAWPLVIVGRAWSAVRGRRHVPAYDGEAAEWAAPAPTDSTRP